MPDRADRMARELRGQAIVLSLVLWAVLAVNWATPSLADRFSGQVKGPDFVQFYSLGAAVRAGAPSALTSFGVLHAVQARAVPESAGDMYPPVYPPQVGVAFAPLAALPYPLALAIWLVLSAGICAASTRVFWKACPRLRPHGGTVAWLASAFPPMWWLAAHGQLSALALGALALACLALARGRRWLAGCAIGLLAYKWTLFVPAVVVVLLAGELAMVAGATVVAAGQLALAVPFVGMTTLRQHVAVMIALGRRPGLVAARPWLMHSLRTFWAAVVPEPSAAVLYLVTALCVLVVAALAWRRAGSAVARVGCLACAIVLAAPHLYAYDLVILVPALLVGADCALAMPAGSRSRKWLSGLTYAVFLGMMIGLSAFVLRIQVATVLLASWFVLLVRAAAGRSGAPAEV